MFVCVCVRGTETYRILKRMINVNVLSSQIISFLVLGSDWNDMQPKRPQNPKIRINVPLHILWLIWKRRWIYMQCICYNVLLEFSVTLFHLLCIGFDLADTQTPQRNLIRRKNNSLFLHFSTLALYIYIKWWILTNSGVRRVQIPIPCKINSFLFSVFVFPLKPFACIYWLSQSVNLSSKLKS